MSSKDDNFENDIQNLPNDLGSIPADEPQDKPDNLEDGVPMFDNSDLVGGKLSSEELMTLMRLFPVEDIAAGCAGAPAEELREMAFDKLNELSGTFSKLYDIRDFLTEIGGDTSEDLDCSMLSIIGEMSRLRTLIPKLEAGTL